eukprot:TRINITY_DN7075_c0_g1_i1.p1 TRINITY_DN7075_c0_g1~~TRINITY_DN7075_c0_g1_i1.p1  ORF type:complete len:408 (+),score=46.99 TRINITY_DN7075_c0_g1_i1:156-1379(+)
MKRGSTLPVTTMMGRNLMFTLIILAVVTTTQHREPGWRAWATPLRSSAVAHSSSPIPSSPFQAHSLPANCDSVLPLLTGEYHSACRNRNIQQPHQKQLLQQHHARTRTGRGGDVVTTSSKDDTLTHRSLDTDTTAVRSLETDTTHSGGDIEANRGFHLHDVVDLLANPSLRSWEAEDFINGLRTSAAITTTITSAASISSGSSSGNTSSSCASLNQCATVSGQPVCGYHQILQETVCMQCDPLAAWKDCYCNTDEYCVSDPQSILQGQCQPVNSTKLTQACDPRLKGLGLQTVRGVNDLLYCGRVVYNADNSARVLEWEGSCHHGICKQCSHGVDDVGAMSLCSDGRVCVIDTIGYAFAGDRSYSFLFVSVFLFNATAIAIVSSGFLFLLVCGAVAWMVIRVRNYLE